MYSFNPSSLEVASILGSRARRTLLRSTVGLRYGGDFDVPLMSELLNVYVRSGMLNVSESHSYPFKASLS